MSELVINRVRQVKASDDPLIFAKIRCQYGSGRIAISAEPEKKDPEEFAALVIIDRIRRTLVSACIPHEIYKRRRHDSRKDVTDRISIDLREIKEQGKALPISLFDDILPLAVLQYL